MTRRRDVLSTIAAEARAKGVSWELAREGANHTVYSLDDLLIPIARHNEIDNIMVQKIYKECEAKLGKGWWR